MVLLPCVRPGFEQVLLGELLDGRNGIDAMEWSANSWKSCCLETYRHRKLVVNEQETRWW